jgi:hypothetical protein
MGWLGDLGRNKAIDVDMTPAIRVAVLCKDVRQFQNWAYEWAGKDKDVRVSMMRPRVWAPKVNREYFCVNDPIKLRGMGFVEVAMLPGYDEALFKEACIQCHGQLVLSPLSN